MNHCDKVLSVLSAGNSLTAKDALAFGCFRLAARVKDLRDRGYNMSTIKEKNANGSYHARYVMATSACQ